MPLTTNIAHDLSTKTFQMSQRSTDERTVQQDDGDASDKLLLSIRDDFGELLGVADIDLFVKYIAKMSFEQTADWLKTHTDVRHWGVDSIEIVLCTVDHSQPRMDILPFIATSDSFLDSFKIWGQELTKVLTKACQRVQARLKDRLQAHARMPMPGRLCIPVWISEYICASALLFVGPSDAEFEFAGPNAAQDKYCQLLTACASGDVEAVHACMREGAELVCYNDKGNIIHTALHWVCQRLQVSVLQVLFEHYNAQAYVNVFIRSYSRPSHFKQACTPLDLAFDSEWHYGQPVGVQNAVVRMLLEHGADPNLTLDGDAPLHRAMYSDPEVVATLLEFDADPNAVDKYGNTPLLSDAMSYEWNRPDNVLSMLKLLIAAGADVNFQNGSPLRKALYDYQMPLEETCMLIKAGAAMPADDKTGNTALHRACQVLQNAAAYDDERGPLTIKCMLQHGFDINAANKEGYTPLHTFSNHVNDGALVELLREFYGDFPTEGLDLLLHYGADCNALTNHGESPLLLTLLSGYEEDAKTLEHHGARLQADKMRPTTSCLPGPFCIIRGVEGIKNYRCEDKEWKAYVEPAHIEWLLKHQVWVKEEVWRLEHAVDRPHWPAVFMLACLHAYCMPMSDQYVTSDRAWDMCVKWSYIAIRDDEKRENE
eukprot:TRINITY_DN11906_c0_g1_i15.p1 TRINITY_DN11906_c0_g1~~TRINITY_DN11906_c0_g1_i15.p1  ORF type:complete len:655 (+),score=96.94 TRINITY_DN11906_c0_g1_i15:11-1975(+)